MEKHKIIIADDHLVIIDGLRKMLENSTHLSIVGSIFQAIDIIPTLQIQHADILILDVNMHNTNTFKIAPEIISLFPTLKIIAFTSYDTPALRKEAARIGIHAFLTKNVSQDLLLRTISNCLGKSQKIVIQKKMLSEENAVKDQFFIEEVLSHRELEILKLVAQGNTSQEIAATLCISKHTVQWHRKNIISKLQLQSASEMVKFAHEHGIV